MGRIRRSLQHGWNAFSNQDTLVKPPVSHSYQPRRQTFSFSSDKSIISSVYTRLAVDFSQIEFEHSRVDETGKFLEFVNDGLNDCITLDPNIDQTSQSLFQDLAFTLFEEGSVAVVPTETDNDINATNGYDVKSMRVARILSWHPRHVTVEVYDDREVDASGAPVNGGITKQLLMPKSNVAIIENPFYSVMNEPNGTLQRLLRKLSLLDSVDEAAGSGKLDIIFQLPYTTRAASRQKQAEDRRNELLSQLKDDPLGVAYIDVSENVIQLNRPVDNKLITQVEYLTNELYTQLGLTPEIMNGTASRDVINTYYDRTIEPVANAVALEFKRKFLSKKARTLGHTIEYYRDPLKLIPISDLAEIADKLTRNRVVTGNELRPKIGLRPSPDPAADQLHNFNMPTDMQPNGYTSEEDVDEQPELSVIK